MDSIATIPVWILCLLVFVLRVADVTLGTVRTVAIVKGFVNLAMVLGFAEVTIWVVVISQVIARVHESWLLVIAYAGGFAAGNGCGILIERRLALGVAVVRIVSTEGRLIAERLREAGHRVTTFQGEGLKGPVTLVYAAGARRSIQEMIAAAKGVDPALFYVMEPAYESSHGIAPRLRTVLHATGWRSVVKKK